MGDSAMATGSMGHMGEDDRQEDDAGNPASSVSVPEVAQRFYGLKNIAPQVPLSVKRLTQVMSSHFNFFKRVYAPFEDPSARSKRMHSTLESSLSPAINSYQAHVAAQREIGLERAREVNRERSSPGAGSNIPPGAPIARTDSED